jgi:hypothetical protein
MQEKTLADKSARVVGKVDEKPSSSLGLKGSDRSDHISLESFGIINFKRSYKELPAVNNQI